MSAWRLLTNYLICRLRTKTAAGGLEGIERHRLGIASVVRSPLGVEEDVVS
jgi:hypothetical protein